MGAKADVYRIVWRYEVRPECLSAFARAYGARGDWVELFRRDDAYLGTELFRSAGDPLAWATVDTWASRAAYEAFRRRWADDYAAIDARCEGLTTAERLLAAEERPER
ncbi:MAG TPA: antibiotic biosynthesis monooxygenase family protein [Gemmatimonadales bacterium]|nr:antibiotic biosynthesis monooxygenase family protein [Gemmatimonadales bacterium]